MCGGVRPRAGRQTPAALPTQPDVAVGTVKAGALSVTLAHAYASGPIDDFNAALYRIVLTDSPVPPEGQGMLRFGGAQPLLRASKLSGLSLTVDQNGAVRTV